MKRTKESSSDKVFSKTKEEFRKHVFKLLGKDYDKAMAEHLENQKKRKKNKKVA